MKTVLVLGGRGFIGRHAVRVLAAAGCRVVIGTRHVNSRKDLAGVQALPVAEVHLERMCRPCDWAPLLRGVDVVINCVGILRERRGETWIAVHRDAPEALYRACCEADVAHLIQISALGLSAHAASGFISSKWLGEIALAAQAAQHARPACTVVRPSLLEGADGFGSRWLRFMAALPLLAMPKALSGKLAVLDVDDLGAALAALALRPALGFAVEELGGQERRTMVQHIAALRRASGKPAARVLALPYWLAASVARACDLLHFSPFSRGHLELMCHDNLPRGRRLGELLGREPRAIGRERSASANGGVPLAAGS